ncbi:carotene epsilon-monooxygenase [Tanacetum coccineum]
MIAKCHFSIQHKNTTSSVIHGHSSVSVPLKDPPEFTEADNHPALNEPDQTELDDHFKPVEPQNNARRRAVVPSLHKKYLSVIVDRVFCKCSERFVDKLKTYALNGTAVNMEEQFSQLTLDVIGLAVFNYNFDSLTSDSPVIESVYTALKEAEARSTEIFILLIGLRQVSLPIPFHSLFTAKVEALIDVLCKIIPRQIKAQQAVTIIRETVEELIFKCKEMVEKEGEKIDDEDYVNDADPSILRFLLASREEVTSQQLRDDLLSMLVAGHETTGSVLTWTAYLLSKDPSSLVKAQEEVDRVLQGRPPTYEDIKNLKYIPFSGGPRKCVGDQFAMMEAIVALAIFLQKMEFELVPDQKINMTTGATIHTTRTNVRYHLPDFRRGRTVAIRAPRGYKETYDYPYSSLRNVIERTFRVWKAWWAMLKDMHVNYPNETQLDIVITSMALHNYTRTKDNSDDAFHTARQETYNQN